MSGAGRWGDLAPRVLSAIVMLAVGGGAIWAGGAVFAVLAVVCSGLMMWELARMTHGEGRDASVLLGLLAAAVLALNLFAPQPWAIPLFLLPVLAGVVTPRRDAAVFAACALAILATGWALVALRQGEGLVPVLWLLAVVVVSDVAGYFAGRIFGGPKFWPAISPKKTWSGTVAGWGGAALVGVGFWLAGYGGPGLVALSVVIALAGQMGDIWESWVKRRCGVKDASTLIPGHGGVLDRFDALIGAIVVLILLGLIIDLPLPAAV